METTDFRAFYLAYRRGKLNQLHPIFENEMRPQAFADNLTTLVVDYFDAAWTFFQDDKPIAMLFGRLMGDLCFIGSLTWVEDVSPRDKLAASVNFLVGQREADYTCMWTAEGETNGKFSLRLAQYAVARRVGTAHLVERAAKVFEVRRE